MKIERTVIERIRITGSYRDDQKAIDYCTANNYHVIEIGPKRISGMRYDTTHFVIIAERKRPE